MNNEELEKTINEKFFPGEPLRSFTSNIEAAFDILTKLHGQGWFWRLDSVHDGVICTVQNIARKTYSIRAANISSAISECALKTLSEEK